MGILYVLSSPPIPLVLISWEKFHRQSPEKANHYGDSKLLRRSTLSFLSLLVWFLPRQTPKFTKDFLPLPNPIPGKDRENTNLSKEIPCLEFTKPTKPKKGQFMNFPQGHSGTKVRYVNRACFPKEKHQKSQKMGEIRELFVLALSLVWFAGATPEFF